MTILSHMAPDNIFTLENCIEPPWYGCQLRNFIVFMKMMESAIPFPIDQKTLTSYKRCHHLQQKTN